MSALSIGATFDLTFDPWATSEGLPARCTYSDDLIEFYVRFELLVADREHAMCVVLDCVNEDIIDYVARFRLSDDDTVFSYEGSNAEFQGMKFSILPSPLTSPE
jgi:hypothetical protein